MANGTLINHCGARLVTKGDLERIPAPPPTDSWFPIRHFDVLEAVEETIQEASFEIKACRFAISKQNCRFFGVLDLKSELADGVSLSVGIRNSNDKTFPIGFCIGNRTFVCDNLAFSSEVIISKRHTRFGESRFREGIAEAIGQLSSYQHLEAKRIELLQHLPLSETKAESLMLQAWDKKLIGSRKLRPLLDEWRNPSFEEFEPRNGWSMLSAFTHVAKDRQRRYPHRAAYEVMQFQNLLAA
ncbi:hypothetical protein [Mariniblastus fucicola]|uniref:DUF932 domain-containing protein n=1 Tax=Mariniblastus fucicola TaxID=980251 RepID=A0A5B9P3N0_9BACT|nr:hypothetical protein [Mariniblastus fucicola]QEG21008.1 hypothetical protein MFFC18_08600 [Mariniblastus fucicola]